MPEEIYRKSVPLFGGTQDIVAESLPNPNLKHMQTSDIILGQKIFPP